MLLTTNKVSPASLCRGGTDGKALDRMSELRADGGYPSVGSASSGEESQYSQSLFGSMELFSQNVNSQSQLDCPHVANASNQELSDDGKSARAKTLLLATVNGSQSSQGSLASQSAGSQRLKYYMRYLSTAALTASKAEAPPTAPWNGFTKREVNLSRTSFDEWRTKQQEKQENNQVLSGVIETTKAIAKELSQTMEVLKLEIKESITASQQKKHDGLLSEQQAVVGLCDKLLQGQVELQHRVEALQRERESTQTLVRQFNSLETRHLQPLGETVKENHSMADCLRSVETKVNAIMEQMERMAQKISTSARNSSEEATILVPTPTTAGINPAQGRRDTCCEPVAALADGPCTSQPLIHHPTSLQGLLTSQQCTSQVKASSKRVVSQSSLSSQYDLDLTQESTLLQCSQIAVSQRQCGALQQDNLKDGATFGTLSMSAHVPATDSTTPVADNCSIDKTSMRDSDQLNIRRRRVCSQTGSCPQSATLKPSPAAGRATRKSGIKRKDGEKPSPLVSKRLKSMSTQSPLLTRKSKRLRKLVQTRTASLSSAQDSAVRTPGTKSVAGIPGSTGQKEANRLDKSPINALNDSFYCKDSRNLESVQARSGEAREGRKKGGVCGDHTEPTSNAATPDDFEALQPPQAAHIPTTSNTEGKFQRSSEAAKRRMSVMSGLLDSESLLKEIISKSIKQQISRESELSDNSP